LGNVKLYLKSRLREEEDFYETSIYQKCRYLGAGYGEVHRLWAMHGSMSASSVQNEIAKSNH
jgi:hypothetical protein